MEACGFLLIYVIRSQVPEHSKFGARMDNFTNIFLTAFCVSIPIGIIVLFAIWGTKSKQRYAKEIQDNISKGYYSNWLKRPLSFKLRLMGLVQAVNLLGVLLILFVWINNSSSTLSITLACVTGVILTTTIILGILMFRLLRKR